MGRFIAPADITYDELGRSEIAGQESIAKQAGRVAREHVCGLYETFPGGLLRLVGAGTTALTGQNSLLDRMCRPINKLPPAPTQQFAGGQCPGYSHLVRVTTTLLLVGLDESVSQNEETFSIDVFTPIYDVQLSGVNFLQAGGQRIKAAQGIVIFASAIGLDGKPYPFTYRRNKYVNAPNRGTADIRNVSVDPNPSDPMNCDLQPRKYEDKPIPLVNITNNANLTIAPTINIIAPITIIPTLIAPVYASIRPEINVDVGGIRVNFANDGVRVVSPGTEPVVPNPVYDPRPNPPATINVDNSTEVSTPVDIQPILDRLKDIQDEVDRCCDRDRPHPSPDATKTIATVIGSGNSGYFDVPSETFKITLGVVTTPIKVKQQDGFNAPDVLYAGWAWFGSSDYVGIRHPVDSELKIFSPPPYNASKFGFTLYDGMSAIITAYSIRPEPTAP